MKKAFLFLVIPICLITIAVAQPSLPETKLKECLDNSSLVIVGQVVTVDPIQFDGEVISEHSPNWHMATVKVIKTLKGYKKKQVLVVFPMSKDVAWYKSPKLTVGQKAIFILNGFLEAPKAIRPGFFYSALNPLQVQEKKNLKKIKHLLEDR